MEKKYQVHNLIILDESGSMESIKPSIINGFNELVRSIKGIQQQFPEQEHFISIISFNGLGNKIMHFIDPVSEVNTINSRNYKPDSVTPLYDAIGFGLSKLNNHLENQKNYTVLVTVLTDGEENASKEYSGLAVKNKIDELSEGNWTFTYIGTDHDVEKMASSLSIKNTMKFNKNEEGINSMFEEEFQGRVRYSMNVREGKNFKENYFKKGEDLLEESKNEKPITEDSTKKRSLWDKTIGKVFPIIILALFFATNIYGQENYQSFTTAGFKVKCGCQLYTNTTFIQAAKQQGANNIIGAYICGENEDSAETGVINNINIYDESRSYKNIAPSNYAYFEKKALEQYALNLTNAGMSYGYTTFQGVAAIEYSFDQGGTLPTKAIIFYKNNKSYLLQVATRKNLIAKYNKLKTSFVIL
jgi:hypothetical protein